jgi:hypothetical protein
VLSREAAHISFIVFGMTLPWPDLEPKIYHTRQDRCCVIASCLRK